MLLYGPPGTGKTLLARAVAHHTDCTFIRVSGSELVQKYIGEGSRMVRELFVMARCALQWLMLLWSAMECVPQHDCAMRETCRVRKTVLLQGAMLELRIQLSSGCFFLFH